MSDLWLNIRIGVYHIEAKTKSPWHWTIARNDYWKGKWYRNPIAVYDFALLDILHGEDGQ